jgi:hypothetical protein
MFHCHIFWHKQAGLATVLLSDPTDIRKIEKPSAAWEQLCPMYVFLYLFNIQRLTTSLPVTMRFPLVNSNWALQDACSIVPLPVSVYHNSHHLYRSKSIYFSSVLHLLYDIPLNTFFARRITSSLRT